ncbi:MAG: hypothetical protein KAI90_06480 [Desulfobulbaceae bacterium]|nr:hypothetical protein [Desulfobulbaceae bacterium]
MTFRKQQLTNNLFSSDSGKSSDVSTQLVLVKISEFFLLFLGINFISLVVDYFP